MSEGATHIWRLEARDTTPHPTMHRVIWLQNVSSAKAEKGVNRSHHCPFKSGMPYQFTSLHSPLEITKEDELLEGCPVEI